MRESWLRPFQAHQLDLKFGGKSHDQVHVFYGVHFQIFGEGQAGGSRDRRMYRGALREPRVVEGHTGDWKLKFLFCAA
jgi:hypothetical protein